MIRLRKPLAEETKLIVEIRQFPPIDNPKPAARHHTTPTVIEHQAVPEHKH
jgi:hypothetical protein